MIFAILTSAMVTALVVMLAFPRLPAARHLHRALVEPPARFLLEFSWAKLRKALLMTAAAIVLLAFMGPEGMMLSAIGLDATAIVEITIIVFMMAASSAIAAVWRTTRRVRARSVQLVRTISSPKNQMRAPRRRRYRPRKDDDKVEPGWALV
jgi:ABC-type bacteriocin/lantibiotic exporter with double-glycine peptidase domain